MTDIPDDFPRDFSAPTLPGAQAKFMARRIGGRFVVGLTNEELHQRWANCEDLAHQLAVRTQRKQVEGLVSDLDTFYRETEHRVRGQGWDLTNEEVIWLMKRTRALAGSPDMNFPQD